MDSSGKPALTARQALIAAALTGWKGDGPIRWYSPVHKEDIVGWGQSYAPHIPISGFDEDFEKLTTEGCWNSVEYPIFAEEAYYCQYQSQFIQELPDPVNAYIAANPNEPISKSGLTEFWEDLFDFFSEESGAAWIYWGVCPGQGSQYSGAPEGACLGPSCCWFKDGKLECNWGLRFKHRVGIVYPDMSLLDASNVDEWAKTDQGAFCELTLAALAKAAAK